MGPTLARIAAVAISPTMQRLSLVTFFALAATVYQAQQGALFSWDSDAYLITANKLAHLFSLERGALYAPLYPLTISIPQFVGFDTLQAVQIAWFISFLLIAGSAYILSRSVIVAAMALLFLFANEATAYHYRFAWTEMGYAALLTTAISGLFLHITDTKNKIALFVFLMTFALLPVQRYIGGYMSLLLGLIFIGYSVDRKMFLQRAGMTALATIPSIMVVLHNYALTGHLTGERSAAESSFLQNVEFTWLTLVQSFRGEMVLVVSTIAFALVVLIRRKKQRKLAVLLLLLALLPIAQVIFQNIASSLVRIDQVNERYFIVLTPIVFINAIIVASIWEPSRRWPLFIAAASALLANAVLGQSDQYSPSKPSAFPALPLQQYLTSLPVSEVALFADGTHHLWADEVLTNEIIPPSHCQSYQAIGDFSTTEAVFAPGCDDIPGHSYHPVANPNEVLDYPVVLILPLGKYFEFVGALHSLGYGIQRIENVLIMERVQ